MYDLDFARAVIKGNHLQTVQLWRHWLKCSVIWIPTLHEGESMESSSVEELLSRINCQISWFQTSHSWHLGSSVVCFEVGCYLLKCVCEVAAVESVCVWERWKERESHWRSLLSFCLVLLTSYLWVTQSALSKTLNYIMYSLIWIMKSQTPSG